MILTLIASHTTILYAETELTERVILGWVEWIQLQPSDKYAKAKLDTGAKTSSLHAKNIEWFEKDGNDWVRFQFSPNTKLSSKQMLEGRSRNFVTIEAPVVRSTRIKQHKRASAERPVIHQKFVLDGKEYDGEFTLTDRSRFIYPVLLGRRFLENAAIVDPARTYLRTSPPPEPVKKKAAAKDAADKADTRVDENNRKDSEKPAADAASKEKDASHTTEAEPETPPAKAESAASNKP